MDPVGAANLGSAPSSSSGPEAGCRLLHSTAKQGRLTRTRAHTHAHAHSREHTHTHARARSASDRSRVTPAPVARASPEENHANGAFRLVSANSRVLTAAHRSGRVRCSHAGQGAQLPHRRVAPKTSSASGPARRPRTSARCVGRCPPASEAVSACARGSRGARRRRGRSRSPRARAAAWQTRPREPDTNSRKERGPSPVSLLTRGDLFGYFVGLLMIIRGELISSLVKVRFMQSK